MARLGVQQSASDPAPGDATRALQAATSRRQTLWALLLLAGLALAAYANTFSNPFVFDDIESIVESPNVRHLWPPSRALAAPAGSGASGRPLVALTLAVNYAFGGLQPAGYHASNLALHVLAACVLFLLLRGTLAGPRLGPRMAAGAQATALAVSALWTVHPLHTSAIDHIVYRNETMVSLFYLLVLECLRRGAASKRRGWYACAVVSCALGMASKEVMVTSPLVALLYDRLFLAASWRQVWDRRRGVYAGLAATWIVLALCVSSGDRGASVSLRFEDVTPVRYAWTQFGVVVHDLRLVFWPHPLVLDYDWPVARGAAAVAPQVFLIVLLWSATAFGLWRAPRLGFLGVWFFAILSPTSSIVPLAGAVAAEHRMVLPLVAPLVLVVLGLRALRSRVGSGARARAAGALLVGACCVLLGLVTLQRNREYASALSIWSTTVRQRPANARAHGNLGTALVQAGRLPEAHEQFATMVRLDPLNAAAHANLGITLVRLGDSAAGMRELEKALALDPRDARVHSEMAQARVARGDVAGSIASFTQALRLRPDLATARHGLGLARLQQGDVAGAEREFRQVLEVAPDDVGALNNLAWLLATAPEPALRHAVEAVRCAERAARLTGGRDADVLATLAAAYAEAGRFDAASRTLEHALTAATGRAPLVSKLEARMQDYRAQRPTRMPASAPADSIPGARR